MRLMNRLYNVIAFEFVAGPITIPQGFGTGWMIWLLLHIYGGGSSFQRIRETGPYIGLIPVYEFMWGAELMVELTRIDFEHLDRVGDGIVPVLYGIFYL